MKKVFLFCSAALLLTLEAAPNFAPKAISPRSYKEENRQIVLTEKGEVKFQLYLPKTAPSSMLKKAQTFAELLTSICGKKIEVKRTLKPGKTALRIADEKLAQANKIDLSKIDRDGYVIAAIGNDILIAGGDAVDPQFGAGTLYGCYEFLERFAGARFYFPGKYGTILPKDPDWRVNAMTLYDRPDSQVRRIYWRGNNFGFQKWYEPIERGKQWQTEEIQRSRLREGTMFPPNCHGLAYLGYVRRFAKTHPEYFALKPDGKSRHDGSVVRVLSDKEGHLCFSNSGIMEVIYQDAKAVLSGQSAKSRDQLRPDGTYRWMMHNKTFFNLMPNDSMARCCCKDCAPHYKFKPGERYSREANLFLWKQLLPIPRRLKAEKVPGYVTMMAYDLCKEPPVEEIPDNVVIQVATTGAWKEHRKEAQAKDDALLKLWNEKNGSKIYLWNYSTKYNVNFLPDVPNFTPKAIGTYYKRMFRYSFGTFLEAESDYWFFGHLNFYVFSKLMWDHTLDVDQLLEEYCRLMFGKGAKPMLEIFDSLENHWLDDICGNTVETPVGPQNTPPSEYKLWNEIYSPKEIARINGKFDAAVKLAASDKEAVERIKFVRKALWQPTCDGSKKFFRNNAAIEYWQAEIGKAETAPVIDGKADDAVWKNAPQLALIPLKQDKAEVLTFVKLLADKDYFYFFFDCREPDTAKMHRTPRKFDDPMVWSDNAVEIHLDTAGTRKEDYQIMVNSDGVIADLRNEPAHLISDWKWNSGAVAKTSVTPGKGWCVEVKVPRSSYPAVKGKTFFANFTRHRMIDGKKVLNYYVWSPYAKTFCDLANFGTLRFGPPAEKNLFTDPDFTVTGIRGAKGSEWFNWGGIPPRDTEIFRTVGVSMRLEGKKMDLVHKMPWLKPDTEYRLSFFVKMQDVKLKEGKSGGFYIRFDEGNQKVIYLPRDPFFGTIPWTRLEYTFRTSKNKPGTKYKPYIHFTVRKSSGTVWLDHMEIVETGK